MGVGKRLEMRGVARTWKQGGRITTRQRVLIRELSSRQKMMRGISFVRIWRDEKGNVFRVAKDWSRSSILNVYKSDALICGSYRGIKLLEHAIKVLERVIEGIVIKIVKIYNMQFGFNNNNNNNNLLFIHTLLNLNRNSKVRAVASLRTFSTPIPFKAGRSPISGKE